MPYRKNEYMRSLMSLWINWIVSVGAISLTVGISFFISPMLLPVCMIVMIFFLSSLMRSNKSQTIPMCSHIVWIGIYTIIWSAVIMFIINLLHTRWLLAILGRFFDVTDYNSGVPYIPSLILYPVALIVTIVAAMKMGHTSVCSQCIERHGFTLDEGFVGNLIHNEARYQGKVLSYTSIFLTLIGWGYYFLFYINININAPDKFFFIIVPIAAYAVSVLVLTLRYMSLANLVEDPTRATETHNATIIRYLIIKDDFLLLSETKMKSIDIMQWDTPAIVTIPFRQEIDDDIARKQFEKISGYEGQFTIRRVYSNCTNVDKTNLFHYAVFLPADLSGEPTPLKLPGTWMTLYSINNLMKANKLSAALSSEINRIYTITMAWKTYTPDGHRLYPIKNYRPSFRLRDFHTWDVDYDDLRWLNVASNNEDRRFYKLRRLWRRIV